MITECSSSLKISECEDMNPGKSYLGSDDVPRNRAGRVAVSVMIDGGDQCAVDVPGILEGAVYRDGKRLVSDPAFAQLMDRVQVVHILRRQIDGLFDQISKGNPALTNEQVLFMAYSLRRLQEKSPS